MESGAQNVDHARATELFSAYWDKDLAKEDVNALEDHLKACVVCRREYLTFEKTIGAVAHLHPLMAPPEFGEGVRARIRKRSRGRFFSPRRMVERIPYELFSLVMLALILAIYIVLQLSHPANLTLP